MKVIVFDFDGTLEEWANFEDQTEEVIGAELAKIYDVDPHEFKKVFDNIKRGYLLSRSLPMDFSRVRWFSEAFAHFGISADVDEYVEKYWEELISLVKPFPGTTELLRDLSKNYKIALLSDSDGDRYWKLKRIRKLGIEPYFDLILTSDDIGVNKPHPRCFTAVTQFFNVKPEDCVMVGDHPEVDHSMAHHLGFTCIWTRQNITGSKRDIRYPYVDYMIDDIREVTDVIKKIEKVGREGSVQHATN